MGSSSKVGLIAPRQLTVTLPAGLDPAISAKVVYQGPIKAPIKAGQHIADLVVSSPDMPAQLCRWSRTRMSPKRAFSAAPGPD